MIVTPPASGGSDLPDGTTGDILTWDGGPTWASPGVAVPAAGVQPVIKSVTSNYGSSGNGSIVLPSGIEAGDTIALFIGCDFPMSAIDGGFNVPIPKTDNFINGTLALKVADGSEDGSTVHLTLTGSQAWTVYCVLLSGVKYIRETVSPIRNTGGTPISAQLNGGPTTDLQLILGVSHQGTTSTLNSGTAIGTPRIDAQHTSGMWKKTPSLSPFTYTYSPGSSNGNIIVGASFVG